MKIEILRNGAGKASLKRCIAFFGFLIVSIAFILMGWHGKLSSDSFITYPIGLTILYAPQLSVTLLKIWKGDRGNDN